MLDQMTLRYGQILDEIERSAVELSYPEYARLLYRVKVEVDWRLAGLPPASFLPDSHEYAQIIKTIREETAGTQAQSNQEAAG